MGKSTAQLLQWKHPDTVESRLTPGIIGVLWAILSVFLRGNECLLISLAFRKRLKQPSHLIHLFYTHMHLCCTSDLYGGIRSENEKEKGHGVLCDQGCDGMSSWRPHTLRLLYLADMLSTTYSLSLSSRTVTSFICHLYPFRNPSCGRQHVRKCHICSQSSQPMCTATQFTSCQCSNTHPSFFS